MVHTLTFEKLGKRIRWIVDIGDLVADKAEKYLAKVRQYIQDNKL